MKSIEISSIQVVPIKPQNGLVGFASAIINDQFYIGCIAIYTCPKNHLGFRLVFPNKKLPSGQAIDVFHPVSRDSGDLIEETIIKEYLKLMDNFGGGHVPDRF